MENGNTRARNLLIAALAREFGPDLGGTTLSLARLAEMEPEAALERLQVTLVMAAANEWLDWSKLEDAFDRAEEASLDGESRTDATFIIRDLWDLMLKARERDDRDRA